MNVNSKTISQQFAALWEAEVRAAQMRQAEEEGLAQASELPPPSDAAFDPETAAPDEGVEVAERTSLLSLGQHSEGRLHVPDGLLTATSGPITDAGPKIIVRRKRRFEIPCVSSVTVHTEGAELSSDDAPVRLPRIFLLDTCASGPVASEPNGEHANGFPDSIAFDALSAHENRGMRRASAKLRAPSQPVVTRLISEREGIASLDGNVSIGGADDAQSLVGLPRNSEVSDFEDVQGVQQALPLFFEPLPTGQLVPSNTTQPKRGRIDRRQGATTGSQESLDLDTAGVVLAQLRALEPAQTLVALLLVDRARLAEKHPLHSAPASALSSIIEVAWGGCNPSLLHKLRPLWYWHAAFAAASVPGAPAAPGSGPALSGFTFMTSGPGSDVKKSFGIASSLSLFGLLAQSNRQDALERLPEHLIDADLLSRPAAELTGFGAPARLSILALALQSRSTAFFDWLEGRRLNVSLKASRVSRSVPSVGETTARKPIVHDRSMTRDLGAAIELWALPAQAQSAIALGLGRLTAVTKAAAIRGEPTKLLDDHLKMVASMLQMGSSIDERALLLLASTATTGRKTTGKTKALGEMAYPPSVAAWAEVASRIQAQDRQGTASVQVLIAAEAFAYRVTPSEGSPNMMSAYVAGDATQAVEMFLDAGFDPLLLDHEGLTPREHGVRAGAKHATAIIDRQLARQRLQTLKTAAQALDSIAL